MIQRCYVRLVDGKPRYFDENGRDLGPAPNRGPNGERVVEGEIAESTDLRAGTVIPEQNLNEAF